MLVAGSARGVCAQQQLSSAPPLPLATTGDRRAVMGGAGPNHHNTHNTLLFVKKQTLRNTILIVTEHTLRSTISFVTNMRCNALTLAL